MGGRGRAAGHRRRSPAPCARTAPPSRCDGARGTGSACSDPRPCRPARAALCGLPHPRPRRARPPCTSRTGHSCGEGGADVGPDHGDRGDVLSRGQRPNNEGATETEPLDPPHLPAAAAGPLQTPVNRLFDSERCPANAGQKPAHGGLQWWRRSTAYRLIRGTVPPPVLLRSEQPLGCVRRRGRTLRVGGR